MIQRNKLWALCLLALLCGCSKTVKWKEEVPLNTGDVIWVERSATYVRSGASGNPLQLSWRIDHEALSFDWKGKHYAWTGDADLMLLAISPTNVPTLVAPAADFNSWADRHNYKCTRPFYVEFQPDSSGSYWTWPPSIAGWLYGMKGNLMRHRAEPSRMPDRITAGERNRLDAGMHAQVPTSESIDPRYVSDSCRGKV